MKKAGKVRGGAQEVINYAVIGLGPGEGGRGRGKGVLLFFFFSQGN